MASLDPATRRDWSRPCSSCAGQLLRQARISCSVRTCCDVCVLASNRVRRLEHARMSQGSTRRICVDRSRGAGESVMVSPPYCDPMHGIHLPVEWRKWLSGRCWGPRSRK